MSEIAPTPAQNRVIDAARELLRQGLRPTTDEVRKLLNDGTSNSTITAGMKLFWPLIGEALSTQAEIPDVPERVLACAEELWRTAIQDAKASAEERVDEALAIEAKALESVAKLERQLEDARATLDGTRLELSETRHALDKAQQAHAKLQAELDEVHAENKRLMDQVQAARAQADVVRDKADARVDQLLAQNAALEAERKGEAERQHQLLREMRVQYQEREEALRAEILVKVESLNSDNTKDR